MSDTHPVCIILLYLLLLQVNQLSFVLSVDLSVFLSVVLSEVLSMDQIKERKRERIALGLFSP